MHCFRQISTALRDLLQSRLAHLIRKDETEAKIARLCALSGAGDSNGWQWNREEIYAERRQRPTRF